MSQGNGTFVETQCLFVEVGGAPWNIGSGVFSEPVLLSRPHSPAQGVGRVEKGSSWARELSHLEARVGGCFLPCTKVPRAEDYPCSECDLRVRSPISQCPSVFVTLEHGEKALAQRQAEYL